jgi:hypothetical protein
VTIPTTRTGPRSSRRSRGDKPGLNLGSGVGVVTRPGLGLDVGGPAINPVPRRMISEHVAAEAGDLGLSAATADRAGVFRAAAEAAARIGRGSQPRLLVSLYVAGVLVTAVLSNDATALLLTPVAFAVATRLGLDPRPYAFACALVANAASFLLPVSNPANLLVLASAPLPLGPFLVRLLLRSFLAIALTLGRLVGHLPEGVGGAVRLALRQPTAARAQNGGRPGGGGYASRSLSGCICAELAARACRHGWCAVAG